MSCNSYNRTYYTPSDFKTQAPESRSNNKKNEFIKIPQQQVQFGFPLYKFN